MTNVAITLRGGLGNQLFQWALAVELQHRGTRVTLDTRQVQSARGVAIRAVDPKMRRSNFPSLAYTRWHDLMRGRTITGFRPLVEPSFRYWPRVLEQPLPQRSLLYGYWQSPLYFPSVANTVRQQLLHAADGLLTDKGVRVRSEIRSLDYPVSVHLRRGDYVSNPVAKAFHGVISANYYRVALEQARSNGAERFFVFSDNPEQAHRIFAGSDCQIITSDVAQGPLGELGLMSECRGHILANSSFSWWGAWLDERNSPVVAPKDWFADPAIETQDLLPADWLRLRDEA
jgi:hypothetical protein